MGQKINQSLFQAQANSMENAIQQVLLNQVNTIITAIITTVNDDNTYGVQPTLNYLNLKANPIKPPPLTNIPAMTIRFGNAAIKGKYKKDDAVILGIIQRDISILKKAWSKITNPGSYRKFSLPDAIIIAAVSNTEATTYIEIDDEGINIKAVNINLNGVMDVTDSKVDINAELTINGVPYKDHTHSAGKYMQQNPTAPISGDSGGLS